MFRDRRFRPRVRRWFFAFTAASALVLAAGHAAAGDEDGDRIDDAFELATQRIVEYDPGRGIPASGPAMQLRSYSVGAPTNDRFTVQYRPGEFEVEYVRGSGERLVAISYRMEFHAVVEWRDSNFDGSISRDEVLEWTDLGSDAFGSIPIVHEQNVNADGGVVHSVWIRSNQNEILLTLTIAERFYRVSADRILTPMEIQLDTAINRPLVNFGARLGLELWVDTDDTVVFEEDSWSTRNGFSHGESALNVSAGDEGREASMFFAWADHATVDNRSKYVSHEGPELQVESDEHALLLGYPLGDPSWSASVKHTSSLGVVSAAYESQLHPPPPPLDPDPILFGVSLGAVAGVVALTMGLARRRRVK